MPDVRRETIGYVSGEKFPSDGYFKKVEAFYHWLSKRRLQTGDHRNGVRLPGSYHAASALPVPARHRNKTGRDIIVECYVGDFQSLRNLNLALGLFYNLNFKQTQKDLGSLGNPRLEFQSRLDYLEETTHPCSDRLSKDGHF